MIIEFLMFLAQSPVIPAPSEQVMTCYIQEDDPSQSDPAHPNDVHLIGPKYLIAWKYSPMTAFGISKAPMEVHDPHGFLKGTHFTEQSHSAEGDGFFGGELGRDLFTIGVMPDQTPSGMHRAQFIHTSKKKVAGMAFGYCKADEREAGEAFTFWKVQPETLP